MGVLKVNCKRAPSKQISCSHSETKFGHFSNPKGGFCFEIGGKNNTAK